jgi:glycine dehydrogenase subunit 1
MKKLNAIDRVKAPRFSSPHFKEFVVDFNNTGKLVERVNEVLLEHGIFGGKDLSREFQELGQCAQYCVTEMHTKDDIDTLVDAIQTVTA